jgi:DNA-directed RNA polymerase II subunit RPB1
MSTVLPPLGSVKYIQSFCPTGIHIRKSSVLEVHTNEDLQSGKLGITDWEKACETCDCFLEDCPGHHGHLEIPIPIYRIFFLKRLIQILNCICFYCQSLRLPKTDSNYNWITNLESKHRLSYLVKYSSHYRRCGAKCDHSGGKSGDITGNCGMLFVNFINEDRDNAFLKAVVPLERSDCDAYEINPQWKPFQISPNDVFECLCNLSQETKTLLGCNEWNEPNALMWDVLPIPSHNTRPCHIFSGIGGTKVKAHNDWTKLLKNILTARNELLDEINKTNEVINICSYQVGEILSCNFKECFRYGFLDKKERDKAKKRLKQDQKNTTMGGLEGSWRNLNKQVAAFHSHRHKKFMNKGGTYGKPLVNVEDRYKHQKCGRLRGNVIARRVNNAIRGVLEGDINIRPDQVSIPLQECMVLSKKVYINRLNTKSVHKWIMNGPYKHPGANYIMYKNGLEINLSYCENRRDIDISELLYVQRHIIDGDVVMVNRQPTLHRPSMMAFTAIVIPGFAIRLHYSVFTPMAADCDGDEVNIHIPQTMMSIVEVSELCGVRHCIMKDGKVMIKFIQNAVVGAYMMTCPSVQLSEDEVHDITSFLDLWGYPVPVQLLPEKRWSGHQIISLILPSDFNMCYTSDQSADVIICNGQLLSGRITEQVLNGNNGILNHLYRDYADKEVTIQFLHQGYILFQKFLDVVGLSAGYFDCSLDIYDEEKEKRNEGGQLFLGVMHRLKKVRKDIEVFDKYARTFVNHQPQGEISIETNIKKHLEKINKSMCNAVNDYHDMKNVNNTNGLLEAIKSGAKGNRNILNQMCGIVGQIFVLYGRHGNISSHYKTRQHDLRSYGFLTENYSTGISLLGLISEAPATCESVVNKNKGTSKSGYTVRKLTTCMMGVVIDHFGRAVDTNGRVIWSVYGNDGYDPTTMTNCKLRLLNMSEWEIPKRYGIFCDLKEIIRYSSMSTKKEWSKVASKQESIVDTKWFNALTFRKYGSSSVIDNSNDFDESLTAKAKEVWYEIRHKPETIFCLVQEATDLLLLRNQIRELLSLSTEFTDNSSIRGPFSFPHVYYRCQSKFGIHTQVDMTPLDYRRLVKGFWEKLVEEKLVIPTNLTLKSLFFDWLSTRSLMLRWKFGLKQIHWIFNEIVRMLVSVKIQPGESVGVNATQSMGEPFTQMALKTPHLSGKFPTLMEGTVRINNLIDGNFINPTMTIVLKKFVQTETEARIFGLSIVRSYLSDIGSQYPTYEMTDDQCTVRILVSKFKAIRRLISARGIAAKLCDYTQLDIGFFHCSFASEENWFITVRIPMTSTFWTKLASQHTDISVESVANNIVYNIWWSVVINGLPDISNFIVEEVDITTVCGKVKRWSVSTLGSCLSQIVQLPEVDSKRTLSNDCNEVCEVLGIHAARKSLEREFISVMNGMADERHIKLIARVMASDLIIKGMKIKQVGQSIPPLQRAAYEYGPRQITEYCSMGEIDDAKTICGAALTNKIMNIGTGYNIDLLHMEEIEQPPGLVGKVEKLPDHVSDVAFSPKVDGLRLLLTFFHDRNNNKICNLVDRNNTVFSMPSAGLFVDHLFEGTLLDGDLVQMPGRSTYCFVVFDCLMICGNRSSCLRYDQRIELGREVVYRMGTQDLQYPIKNSNQFEAVDLGTGSRFTLPICHRRIVSESIFFPGQLPFSICVKPLFSLQGLVEFDKHSLQGYSVPTDGYIITKLSAPASPFRNNPTSIFKWKPKSVCGRFNENTIDVIVYRFENEGTRVLPSLPYSFSNTCVEAFRRLDGNATMMVLHKSSLFLFSFIDVDEDFQFETTCECRWNYTDKKWEFFRSRNKKANTLDTVVRCAINILEDVKLEDLVSQR